VTLALLLVSLPLLAWQVAIVLSRRSRGYAVDGDLLALTTVLLLRLAAYSVAAGLWWYLGHRPVAGSRAWLLAVAGLVLVAAAAYQPVSGFALALHDEWRETQPGGRGYHP